MSYNTFNEDFNFFFSAIALGYNLPGVSNLSLSREQIVGIYNGTFLYWNESTFLDYIYKTYNMIELHRWRNVSVLASSAVDRGFEPIKLVFVASPLSMQH
jgi:ABC-type multidrug transport system permease subunit